MNKSANESDLSVIGNSHMHSYKRKRAKITNCFTSNTAKYGDQLGPPSLNERGYRQVPKMSTSKWDNAINDTLVDGVSILGNCKANPIRGYRQDNALVGFDEF